MPRVWVVERGCGFQLGIPHLKPRHFIHKWRITLCSGQRNGAGKHSTILEPLGGADRARRRGLHLKVYM